ncbi:MAG: tetratricopeptide repeat protein [Prevotella sp.]|nr:tetratricopeptide repeat protein [Prevotella sp.]
MAKKNEKIKAQAEAEEMVSKSEAIFKKYKKQIFGCLIAVLVVICGVMLYKQMIVKPRVEKANNAIAKAQNLFNEQQWEKALKGDSTGVQGFIAIAEEYSSTDAGNLANLYAGLCYAKLEKWQESVNYLEKFETSDDVMISPLSMMAAGDAYANVNNLDQAVASFRKAAEMADKAAAGGINNSVSPNALLKAGIILLKQNKKEEALTVFQEIKDKYMQSPVRGEIDKYIQLASN